MALTDRVIRSLKSGFKPVRKTDSHGLYIEAQPTGSKLWRQKYRFGGKEKRLALGSYPEIGLAEARRRRDQNRATLQRGIEPALELRKTKAAARVSAENSFSKVAEEYLAKMGKEGRAPSTLRKARWFRDLLAAPIGVIPVDQVDLQTLLSALKAIEAKGKLEPPRRCAALQVASSVVPWRRRGLHPIRPNHLWGRLRHQGRVTMLPSSNPHSWASSFAQLMNTGGSLERATRSKSRLTFSFALVNCDWLNGPK